MAAKALRNEGKHFALSELNARGERRMQLDDAKREKKLDRSKRRADAKDGFASSLKKVEKRLREAEESALG